MNWDEIEKYIDSQQLSAIREIGQHPIDPEEVMQEVRVKVWKAHDSNRDVKSIRTYVQRTIRNTVIDMKRKAHMRHDRHYVWMDSDQNPDLDDRTGPGAGEWMPNILEPSSQQDIEKLEASMMLEWVLRNVPEHYHGSFLGKLDGMSDKEIADNTGTTLLSHKSRWSRSRKLAERLWDTLKTNS